MFNERLQMDLIFLDDIITLRIMGVFSKYSMLARARPKHPQEARAAFLSSWAGVFGIPKSLHLGEGGERKNDLWRDLCVGRRIKLVLQGAGAHPWILERRDGLARGSYNRLKADRVFSGSQISTKAQWCLNSMVSASGFSAYQLVFGSNPMDLRGWGDSDEDLLFAQDTSISGQSVRADSRPGSNDEGNRQ